MSNTVMNKNNTDFTQVKYIIFEYLYNSHHIYDSLYHPYYCNQLGLRFNLYWKSH